MLVVIFVSSSVAELAFFRFVKPRSNLSNILLGLRLVSVVFQRL